MMRFRSNRSLGRNMRRNITSLIYLLGAFIVLFFLGLHYVHTDPDFEVMSSISLSHLTWWDLVGLPFVAISHGMQHSDNFYVAMLYLIGFSFLSFFVGSVIVSIIGAPFVCFFWRAGAETLNSESRMSLGTAWLFLMGYFWFFRREV